MYGIGILVPDICSTIIFNKMINSGPGLLDGLFVKFQPSLSGQYCYSHTEKIVPALSARQWRPFKLAKNETLLWHIFNKQLSLTEQICDFM